MTSIALHQGPVPAFWAGKRVLVTGHTGFKGSWLTLWLTRLGAEVIGVGLVPETHPNLFELANVREAMAAHHIADIRDVDTLRAIVADNKPEIVLHLAAQALVLPSYEAPLDTFTTNVLGTANVLDALRGANDLRVAVMVTTDKVYQNPENGYPFRESDPLGGHDPYSASKAAAEHVIQSYRKSFFDAQNVAVASARAGNVIGGGDWARHRLIPDAVYAWGSGHTLRVRRPNALRPWQHVLEPLAGYLRLCERLWSEPSLADAYNFGPSTHEVATVREVLTIARQVFGTGKTQWGDSKDGLHEAGLLSLETTKARLKLDVSPNWTLCEGVRYTMDWYRDQAQGASAHDLCERDFEAYTNSAKARTIG